MTGRAISVGRTEMSLSIRQNCCLQYRCVLTLGAIQTSLRIPKNLDVRSPFNQNTSRFARRMSNLFISISLGIRIDLSFLMTS